VLLLVIYVYLHIYTHTLLNSQFSLYSVSSNNINMSELLCPHSTDIHAVEQCVFLYVDFTSVFHFGHGIKNTHTSLLWQNDTQSL
jgi:hypothetical protein